MRRFEYTHPLAVNFSKFKVYDFSFVNLEEVIFFEWLIVKQKCFGEGNYFFYQNKRIIEELGIKRTRLETIKGKFLDYGLQIEQKGSLNITHYQVSYDFIENIVSDFVKEEYRFAYIQNIRTLSFKSEKLTTTEEKEHTLELIRELSFIYNERREVFNELNLNKVRILNIELDFTGSTIYNLSRLMKRYSLDTIYVTFTLFVDYLLEDKDQTTHILNNFSSYDSQQDKFPVFGFYNQLLHNDKESYF
ncbi:hypothetical protein M3P19_15520 [Muricauda sp. 2012CJ35-5]|uniref:Uncharacterized protein n=1 Tax=Flagellimonas spongiicola TaxID=2942208 RepID=A0ABT0PVK3_9FLAO|nr:hypothetical protein [Allomuricauda spongiicola]MCL6275423.1 hypothetical protein [Allomuricauda spongiicola]